MNEPLLPCRDCGAPIGQPHQDGCDIARCLWTGIQRIQCAGGLTAEVCKVLHEADRGDLADELAEYHGLDDPDHDCGNDIWTGVWPGVAEAEEYGWYSYFGPPWVQCGPDHPEATADLNRIHMECDWDRECGRWVKRRFSPAPT